jgi:hypothetical protein
MAFFLESAKAPRARFPLTIADSISGTIPTATDTLNSAAWPQLPVTLPLIARTLLKSAQLCKVNYQTYYRNHHKHEGNHHVSHVSYAPLERIERPSLVELLHNCGNKRICNVRYGRVCLKAELTISCSQNKSHTAARNDRSPHKDDIIKFKELIFCLFPLQDICFS